MEKTTFRHQRVAGNSERSTIVVIRPECRPLDSFSIGGKTRPFGRRRLCPFRWVRPIQTERSTSFGRVDCRDVIPKMGCYGHSDGVLCPFGRKAPFERISYVLRTGVSPRNVAYYATVGRLQRIRFSFGRVTAHSEGNDYMLRMAFSF